MGAGCQGKRGGASLETTMASSSFATEVLADGPIGYWRLGEASGSVAAADASGNGNNGACSSVGITFGRPGFHGGDTAALFDGEQGRIVVLNSNSLNPPHITMEAKVRWDGLNDPNRPIYQRILEKSSFPELAQYGMGILPDGHVRVELRTSSATISVDVNSVAVVAQGVETYVVATYDGSVIRIYLNGVLDSETRAPGTISPKPPTDLNLIESGVGIGNQTQRDRPFNGLIDEVAVYPAALSAERILAHYKSQFAERVTFQYAVKFVCGKSPGEVVAPGVYFTAINVHNPTYTTIRFRVKVAVALPGLVPGTVSRFHHARLGPDEALEIDCPDIFKLLEANADFLKGFVVIESEVELDVVAVYTAAGGDGQVETLHTERVPARPRKAEPRAVCVDFEPPFTVGTQYGAPAGHQSGDVVFTANGIPVSVHDFNFLGGGGTFNVAHIDVAPVPFGNGQSMRTNNINLEFDFSSLGFVPGEVRFEFLDLGGFENISVNGSAIVAGELSSVSSPIGGVNISVTTTPVAGGKKGIVILTGAVQKIRVGGQELWIDDVCARR
jgi:Concanavalin A-like lectin/glucanases superfamily